MADWEFTKRQTVGEEWSSGQFRHQEFEIVVLRPVVICETGCPARSGRGVSQPSQTQS